MSGSGGRNKNGSKLTNSRRLDEDEQDRLVNSIRQQGGVRQVAQDRLKRLQTNLKRIQDKKPIRDREQDKLECKRVTRSSSTSTRLQQSNASPRRRSSVGLPPPPRRSSLKERLKIQPQRVESPQNAWEKPKALLDANNRQSSGSSQSANQRLTQLRASLQQKALSKQETNNNNNNSIDLSSSVASEEDAEPMEWEESMEDPSTEAESNVILLMREATDAEELPARRVDHMYFVLDTNVLMHNLKFVEDLTEVVLPETVGSMLYIPYIVIKELDKLKGRHSDEEGREKRSIAVRAIRYLNSKFDDSLDIQAQSALEESEHLIEVDCPDDSIVNCCLQLQQEVPHMMLLTNDANLRLKANASSIRVATRSDLMADYPEEFATLRK